MHATAEGDASPIDAAKRLIAEHLCVPPAQVRDDADFAADLGADSLDLVELTMRLEDAFEVVIGDDESEGCRTVGDAVGLLDAKLRQKAAGAAAQQLGCS